MPSPGQTRLGCPWISRGGSAGTSSKCRWCSSPSGMVRVAHQCECGREACSEPRRPGEFEHDRDAERLGDLAGLTQVVGPALVVVRCVRSCAGRWRDDTIAAEGLCQLGLPFQIVEAPRARVCGLCEPDLVTGGHRFQPQVVE